MALLREISTSPGHLPGQKPALPSQLPVSTWLGHQALSQTLVKQGDYDPVCGEDNYPIHQICKSFLQWWYPCLGDHGQLQGPDYPYCDRALGVHVRLLPPNTTDQLQPMDLYMNKPAKDFLKWCFEDWYAEQVTTQLDGKEVESTNLEPVSLSLPVLKELGAKWLVQMAEYFTDNPQIIVDEFVKAGRDHSSPWWSRGSTERTAWNGGWFRRWFWNYIYLVTMMTILVNMYITDGCTCITRTLKNYSTYHASEHE